MRIRSDIPRMKPARHRFNARTLADVFRKARRQVYEFIRTGDEPPERVLQDWCVGLLCVVGYLVAIHWSNHPNP